MISGAETRPSTVTMAVTSLRAGLGDEVDLRVEVADELQRALVEVDALAEDQDAPAAQVELADRLDVGGRALHRHLRRRAPRRGRGRARRSGSGALIRTSRPMPARSLVPRRARRRRRRRGRASPAPPAGCRRGSPGRARPGRWRRGPRPPRISVRPMSMRPGEHARRRRPAARSRARSPSRAAWRRRRRRCSARRCSRAVRSAGKPGAEADPALGGDGAAAGRLGAEAAEHAPRCRRARRRARCSAGGCWSAGSKTEPPASDDGAGELRRRQRAAGGGGDAHLARGLGRAARRGAGRPCRAAAMPETLASRPGPAKGMRPEPCRSRPPGAGGAGGGELERAGRGSCRLAVRAKGGTWFAASTVAVMPSPRRSKLHRRVGERAGGAAGAGDRCRAGRGCRRRGRPAPAGRTGGRCRARDRPRRAGPSRWRWRRGRWPTTLAVEVQPAVRGGAGGVDRDRRQAGGAGGRRDEPGGPDVEAHVGRGARPGDAGGAVDGAAEAEVGADGVGDVERQVAHRDVDVEAVGRSVPWAVRLPVAEVERRAA